MVDYDCPENSGDWVNAHHPEVTVVRIRNEPGFNLARARNLGAAETKADWIVFLDADVVPSPHFAEAVSALLKDGLFLRPAPAGTDTWGTLICMREEFLRAAGYDEVFSGWGGEDDDLYARMVRMGLKQLSYPVTLLRSISHDDESRVRYYETKDRNMSQRVNFGYMALNARPAGIFRDRACDRIAPRAACRGEAGPGAVFAGGCRGANRTRIAGSPDAARLGRPSHVDLCRSSDPAAAFRRAREAARPQAADALHRGNRPLRHHAVAAHARQPSGTRDHAGDAFSAPTAGARRRRRRRRRAVGRAVGHAVRGSAVAAVRRHGERPQVAPGRFVIGRATTA